MSDVSGKQNRYSRQVLFPAIGEAGQEKISRSRIVVVGCGALGSVSSEMLVRAGVGYLRVIDRDFVELNNLQRQSLFTESDADQTIPKAIAAQKALRRINSGVSVEGLVQDLTADSIADVCDGFDLLVDGTDNFETRYLINDFAVQRGIPWVYGAALGSYGVCLGIEPRKSPCIRCLFPDLPPRGSVETCDTAGILASVIHVVSATQVSQVLRFLVEGRFSSRMLHVDVWKDEWRSIAAGQPDAICPCCAKEQFEFLAGEQGTFVTQLCGRDAVQVRPSPSVSLDLHEIGERLRRSFEVRSNPYLIRVQIDELEMVLFADGRAVIKGLSDLSAARAVYAKYVGN